MSTPRHSVSVAGVVIDEQDRILLIQRRDNAHWEPPGGILEIDETFEEGVRREIFEETGVAVAVDRLSGVYKNMSKGVVALVFRCRFESGSERRTLEASRVEWKSLEEASTVMSPAYFVRVSDAFSVDVSVRVHDGVNLI